MSIKKEDIIFLRREAADGIRLLEDQLVFLIPLPAQGDGARFMQRNVQVYVAVPMVDGDIERGQELLFGKIKDLFCKS